jgi:hypothetical protein
MELVRHLSLACMTCACILEGATELCTSFKRCRSCGTRATALPRLEARPTPDSKGRESMTPRDGRATRGLDSGRSTHFS